MLIEFASRSDAGRVRKNNEDALLILDAATGVTYMGTGSSEMGREGFVLAVADGAGGHNAGEVASRTACEELRRIVAEHARREGRGGTIASLVTRGIYEADTTIRREAAHGPERHGMCSTMTAACVDEGTLPFLHLVHVGDSRAYIIRENEIARVTRDQTPVQTAIDEGRIREYEAPLHPYRNALDQAVGGSEPAVPVETRVELRDGDILLLCTDGLTNEISGDEALISIVNDARYGGDGTLDGICDELIARAVEQGRDNITVVAARFSGRELAAPNSRGAALGTPVFTDAIEFAVVTS